MSEENKVTQEQLEAKIEKKEFHRLTERLTVAVITTKNGFEIVGQSACVDAANYNQELGEKYAYEQAFNKLWEIEGYLLRERLFGDANIVAGLNQAA